MTLKEELEILRGEPIKVSTVKAKDVPCIETSDPEKLCKHPVVSVQMITYNHEPYIRQAIEGVMMQKTDFEFELIIGEDCSQDKTREICFEYQKKYPDKIRVLWWHENVSKLGGNSLRCAARRRGEFVALCEGDDYWTDPLKLQKQVDVMREHPNVGICFAGADRYHQKSGCYERYPADKFFSGLMEGRRVCHWNVFERYLYVPSEIDTWMINTCTIMFRPECVRQGWRNFQDIGGYKLRFGDARLIQYAASVSDVYFLSDVVGVYRVQPGGLMKSNGAYVMRDAVCVFALMYAVKQFGYDFRTAVKLLSPAIYDAWIDVFVAQKMKGTWYVFRHWRLLSVFLRPPILLDLVLLFLHMRSCRIFAWASRIRHSRVRIDV